MYKQHVSVHFSTYLMDTIPCCPGSYACVMIAGANLELTTSYISCIGLGVTGHGIIFGSVIHQPTISMLKSSGPIMRLQLVPTATSGSKKHPLEYLEISGTPIGSAYQRFVRDPEPLTYSYRVNAEPPNPASPSSKTPSTNSFWDMA